MLIFKSEDTVKSSHMFIALEMLVRDMPKNRNVPYGNACTKYGSGSLDGNEIHITLLPSPYHVTFLNTGYTTMANRRGFIGQPYPNDL